MISAGTSAESAEEAFQSENEMSSSESNGTGFVRQPACVKGKKVAKGQQKQPSDQPPSLITEEEYILLKKENVILENQRLQGELRDQEAKSKLLRLEEIHKRLQIKETRARIAMYNAITKSEGKKVAA